MIPLAIAGVGVCAAGMPDWTAARAILRGDADWRPLPLPKLDIPALPATERRRVNATSRLAINAAMQAVAGMDDAALAALASVFASADGDGQVLANALDALAQRNVAMSPTLFHNSVFNAPAGYWSIASGAGASSTTVSAGVATFSAALLEAGIQVTTTGRPVLFVAFDMPFPETLQSLGVAGDAFACALLLAAAGHGGAPWGRLSRWDQPAGAMTSRADTTAMSARFAGNAAAASLPLLEAIARRAPALVAVPYLDERCIELTYSP